MKALLVALLLLSAAIAGSALTKSDFDLTVKNNPPQLVSGENNVRIILSIDLKKTVNAFDVKVRFSAPTDLSVIGENERAMLESVSATVPATMEWEITASQAGTYDLSNAFEVVSWDDSVKLDIDALPTSTGNKTVTISGWTDADTLCQEHNHTGIWADKETCQVKLTINNKEYWAERSGVFAIPYELAKGENRIDIQAMDPGGNTQETSLSVTYAPTIMDMVTENIVWFMIVFVVVVVGIAGLYLLRHTKRVTQEVVAESTLEQLREKQARVFQDYLKRSQAGGFDQLTAVQLVDNFKSIMKKDGYYSQAFPDIQLAIKEHEDIFQDGTTLQTQKKILLEQYAKALQELRPKP